MRKATGGRLGVDLPTPDVLSGRFGDVAVDYCEAVEADYRSMIARARWRSSFIHRTSHMTISAQCAADGNQVS